MNVGSPLLCSCTGQLVWRRHTQLPPPSHQVLRNTCMQLLPLVEMYCRWELAEDCSDLRALMIRFDSADDLKSHELGRSLLFMLRNDDVVPHMFPDQGLYIQRHNPFDDIRERLQAADVAINALHSQVQLFLNSKHIFLHTFVLTMTHTITEHNHMPASQLPTVCAILRLYYYKCLELKV